MRKYLILVNITTTTKKQRDSVFLVIRSLIAFQTNATIFTKKNAISNQPHKTIADIQSLRITVSLTHYQPIQEIISLQQNLC